jgi:hypothetical protein
MDATYRLPSRFGTSGTKIVAAIDGGGGSIVLSSASGAEHHVDTSGPYGAVAPSLRTDNTAGLLTSTSGGPTGAQPWHLICAFRVDDNSAGFKSFFTFGATPQTNNFSLGTNSGLIYAFTNGGVNLEDVVLMPNGPLGLQLKPGHDHIIEVQYDGATLSYWTNGRRLASMDRAITLAIPDASINFGPWYLPMAQYIVSARVDFFALKVDGLFSRPVVNVWLPQQLNRLGARGASSGSSAMRGCRVARWGLRRPTICRSRCATRAQA